MLHERIGGWRIALFAALAAIPSLAGTLNAAAAPPPAITLQSLLREMTDRSALARVPEVEYTCRQFSSYDRKSTSPDDKATWFANGDAAQYLREETNEGRHEWVMMDTDGPGAVVRIWSANPKGTLRIYLDGAAKATIEATMTEILGGKWKVAGPLSAETSRGWNLYLPIPYAKHCKITSDNGEFYYQCNYRTYPADTSVESFSSAALDAAKALIDQTQATLRAGAEPIGDDDGTLLKPQVDTGAIEPGEVKRIHIDTAGKPAAISQLMVHLDGGDLAQTRRSTVIGIDFDGEQTVWAPVGGFFGADVGVGAYTDWYRSVSDNNSLLCRWVMPFSKSCTISLQNTGKEVVRYALAANLMPWQWDKRSMHFHSAWRQQYPIHAYGGRGTSDFNYVTVQGKGVYVGDTLAVMNPVPEWWGEGDEKVYVDGEKFPSHFGTGSEDYYGYAWCCPKPFVSPFHSQVRCDGGPKDNNWGHTTVTRVRSLDAIPFTKSLQFDIEIWHWKECDEAYAVTTYFYGVPGATANIRPSPEETAREIPQPPPPPKPMKIANAIECEAIQGVITSPGVTAVPQGGFGPKLWSEESQLWVQAHKVGDYVELHVLAPSAKPCALTIYATRSWDYGIVRFTVNGKLAGEDVDMFNAKARDVAATGPIALGTFEPAQGQFVIRAEVVGGNAKSEGTKSFFGLDCVVLEAK